MIVGGTTAFGSSRKARKTYLRMVQSVQLIGFVLKMAQVDNSIVGFSKEDAQRLHHPMMILSLLAYEWETTTPIGS